MGAALKIRKFLLLVFALATFTGLSALPARAQTLDLLTLVPVPSTPSTPVTYLLPGYGNVIVSWEPDPNGGSVPAVSTGTIAALANDTIPSTPPAILGSTVDLFRLAPGSTKRKYSISFSFDNSNTQPDLSRLQLFVFNLGIVNGGKTKVTPNVGVIQGGTYVENFGSAPFPALVTMSGGAIQAVGNTQLNCGAANFTVTSSSLLLDGNSRPTLKLDIDQVGGDEIALTLAYEHRDGPVETSATCCPPLTTDMNMLRNSFAYDQMPGEGIADHYGLVYNPAPAFDAQMQLWAPYAINAMASPGWTGSAIVMWADLRTDGAAPGTGPVSPWPPVPTATDWANGYQVQSGWLRAWWPSGSPWASPNTLADANLPKPVTEPTAHMQPNDRRYFAAITYYIWETKTGSPGRLTKLCDGGLVSVHRDEDVSGIRPDGGGQSKSKAKGSPLEFHVQRARLATPKTMRVPPSLLKAPAANTSGPKAEPQWDKERAEPADMPQSGKKRK